MGNYSAIYINEKLFKVKEITCALTTSVIWTTRLTKTSEFSSPFNGENHICWNTLVTSSWEKIKTLVWQLHLIISFNSSWYRCNLQQSRKKIFFWNVWSSSTTNWGHKHHTKEPNKKLISSILVKNCLNRQAMIWRKY